MTNTSTITRREFLNGETTRQIRRARAARIEQSEHAPELVEHIVGTLGGRHQVFDSLIATDPEQARRAFAVDIDPKFLNEIDPRIQAFAIRAGATLQAIIDNGGAFGLLDGELNLDGLVKLSTEKGAGKIRKLAVIAFAPFIEDFKHRFRQLVAQVRRGFRGRARKRLIVHLVFSLAGGTGSALAVIVAMLIRDSIQSDSPMMSLDIVGHVVGPRPFQLLAATPGERERNLVNTAVALREIVYAQFPDHCAELARRLGVDPPASPLFDELMVFDGSTDGDAVTSLDDVNCALVANLRAHGNEALSIVEASREANPLAELQSTKPETAAASIAAVGYSAMARVPCKKLVIAFARRALGAHLAELLRAGPRHAVQLQVDSLLNAAGIDQLQAKCLRDLQPETAYLMSSIDKLPAALVAGHCDAAERRWRSPGAASLEQRRQRGASELTDALRAARRDLQSLPDRLPSLPDCRLAMRQTADELTNRAQLLRGELERLARGNAPGALLQQKRRFQNQQVGWWRAKSEKRLLRKHFNATIDDEARAAALRLLLESFVEPLLRSVGEAAERIGRATTAIGDAQQRTATAAEAAVHDIGREDACFSEILLPAEVPAALERMSAELIGRAVPALKVADLLNLEGRQELDDALAEAERDVAAAAERYLRGFDVHRFAEHFQTHFRLADWMRGLDPVLPAQLNPFVGPVGSLPVRAYVVAPKNLQTMCREALAAHDGLPAFEPVVADDPHVVALRMKVSGAPIAALNLVEVERAYAEFRAGTKHGTVWDNAGSSSALEAAAQIELLPKRVQ